MAPPSFRIIGLAAIALALPASNLGGCLPIGDTMRPQTTAEPQPSAQSVSFEDLSAGNDAIGIDLITTQSASDTNAFVRNPAWTEYRLTVTSRSARPLTVEQVRLVDSDGIFRSPALSVHALLEPENSSAVGPYAATLGKHLVGTFVPIPGWYWLSMGVDAAGHYGTIAKADDLTSFAEEFERRKLPLGTTLDRGASITGSVFFPSGGTPRALVVDYRNRATFGTLRLPLSS